MKTLTVFSGLESCLKQDNVIIALHQLISNGKDPAKRNNSAILDGKVLYYSYYTQLFSRFLNVLSYLPTSNWLGFKGSACIKQCVAPPKRKKTDRGGGMHCKKNRRTSPSY